MDEMQGGIVGKVRRFEGEKGEKKGKPRHWRNGVGKMAGLNIVTP
jgi:hypothetical protein